MRIFITVFSIPRHEGVRTARWRSIAVGLLLMLNAAPFLWFGGLGNLLFSGRSALGAFWLAWVSGFGLLIYGLVAKSDLTKAALARQVTRAIPPGGLM